MRQRNLWYSWKKLLAMRPVAEFPEPINMGERLWGEETLIAASSQKYTMKKLFVKAGMKGGLQKHHMKDESGYLVSGEMIIRYDNGNNTLVERIVKAGETFRFPPGAVHQEEAISDCVIIECSTPHTNDRIRCEKDYGLVEEEGLPTTKPDEIIII